METQKKRDSGLASAIAQLRGAPELFLLKTGILILVSTAFSYELIRAFSRNAVYLILVVLGAGCVCLGAFLTREKNRQAVRFATVLLLFSLFSLVRNADLRNGVYDTEVFFLSYTFAAIALAFVDRWQTFLLKTIAACSFVHVLCTLILFVHQDPYSLLYPLWLKWYLIPAGTDDGAAAYRGGITTHYSQNATYIIFAVLILGIEILSSHKRKVSLRTWVCFAVSFLALILTNKRAHLLFASATLFALYFLLARKPFFQKLKQLLWIACGAFAGITLLYFAVPDLFQTFFGRFLNSNHGDITSGRIQLWQLALEEFRKEPVFGIGWGGYKYVYRSTLWNGQYFFPLLNTHNVYLQVLCELGILGLGVYALFLVQTFADLWKRCRNCAASPTARITANTALGFFLFYLLYSLTGCCLYDFTFHLLILLFSSAVSLPAQDAAI